MEHTCLSFLIYDLSFRGEASQSVVPGRLELPTSTLSVWRSNQLSYRTGIKLSAKTPSFNFLYILKQTNSVDKKHGIDEPRIAVLLLAC